METVARIDIFQPVAALPDQQNLARWIERGRRSTWTIQAGLGPIAAVLSALLGAAFARLAGFSLLWGAMSGATLGLALAKRAAERDVRVRLGKEA